jgi:hypothetical protein
MINQESVNLNLREEIAANVIAVLHHAQRVSTEEGNVVCEPLFVSLISQELSTKATITKHMRDFIYLLCVNNLKDMFDFAYFVRDNRRIPADAGDSCSVLVELAKMYLSVRQNYGQLPTFKKFKDTPAFLPCNDKQSTIRALRNLILPFEQAGIISKHIVDLQSYNMGTGNTTAIRFTPTFLTHLGKVMLEIIDSNDNSNQRTVEEEN